MAEKCTEQFVLRLPGDLLDALRRNAERDDRATADYIRRALALHVWGVEGSVSHEVQGDNGDRAMQCDARKPKGRGE